MATGLSSSKETDVPTDELEPELDDRFASGEWMGFYVQPDSRQRHAMGLFLEFAQGTISGAGSDPVGEFTIRGTYDTTTAECSWTKQYIGQHSVKYSGRARERGIIGQWWIPGQPAFWCGPFFIWPRALGDLESAFEKAFLEYDLISPLSASPSEPAEVQALGGEPCARHPSKAAASRQA